jgi:hypothetical protein
VAQLLVPLNATAVALALIGWGIILAFQGGSSPMTALGLWLAGVLGPGLGWARWIGVAPGKAAVGLVLGQTLALGLIIVLGLLAALFGLRFATFPLLGLLAIALAISIAVGNSTATPASGSGSMSAWPLMAIFILAAAFRLPFLGYSEFQGDEVEAVLRASGLASGQSSAIFFHGKAPGEVILAGLAYGLGNIIDELGARLPFALASVLAVCTTAILAAELFGRRAGYVAGVLAAIAGYYIAFARITQYQSLVLAFGTAAVLAAATVKPESTRRIWAAGALLGAGLLCHYDAIFAGVPVVILGIASLRSGAPLARWIGAAAVALALPLLFFAPYSLSPLAEQGVDRVTGRVGEIGLRNNVGDIAAAASLYLSTPYIAAIGAIAIIGGVAGLMLRRSQRLPWLLTWCWLIVPVLGYGFIVRKPGTHAHVALLPIILMAAATVAAVIGMPRTAVLGGAIALALTIAAVPVAAHDVALYVNNRPEAVRTNQVPQLPLGRFTLPVPRKERFGFPYQAGWKAVGELFTSGALNGTYDSNENPQVTWWYTRGAWRCTSDPRYYVISEQVQDEIEPPRRRIASDYVEIAAITVRGQVKTRVFEKKSMAGPTVGQIDAENAAERFDQRLASPMDDPGVWARGPVSPARIDMDVPFGDAARFLGFRVYPENPRPGGVVRLDGYWLALFEGERYVPVVTLGDDPSIGSSDGPGCDASRSWAEWRDAQPFAQRVSIPISERARPGTYPIKVRLVDTSTGKLVPSTATNADSVTVGSVVIGSP